MIEPLPSSDSLTRERASQGGFSALNPETRRSGRFQFSVQQLLDIVMFCSVVLGAVVARHEVSKVAVLAVGMLAFQIIGYEWRRKLLLSLGSMSVIGAVCVLLWLPQFQWPYGWTVAEATFAFGAPLGIFNTSLHNIDNDLHPMKGLIGLVSLIPIFGFIAMSVF